jgi:hypothetical protein
VDDFQHHYLMATLMIVMAFVDLDQTPNSSNRVKSWPTRLLLVEVRKFLYSLFTT